jgi:hypothetical protein
LSNALAQPRDSLRNAARMLEDGRADNQRLNRSDDQRCRLLIDAAVGYSPPDSHSQKLREAQDLGQDVGRNSWREPRAHVMREWFPPRNRLFDQRKWAEG